MREVTASTHFCVKETFGGRNFTNFKKLPTLVSHGKIMNESVLLVNKMLGVNARC